MLACATIVYWDTVGFHPVNEDMLPLFRFISLHHVKIPCLQLLCPVTGDQISMTHVCHDPFYHLEFLISCLHYSKTVTQSPSQMSSRIPLAFCKQFLVVLAHPLKPHLKLIFDLWMTKRRGKNEISVEGEEDGKIWSWHTL